MTDEKQICEITGKICYSRKKAGEIINTLKRNPIGKRQKAPKRKKIPMRCYFCKFCKSWHTTHFRSRGKKLKEENDIIWSLKNTRR